MLQNFNNILMNLEIGYVHELKDYPTGILDLVNFGNSFPMVVFIHS